MPKNYPAPPYFGKEYIQKLIDSIEETKPAHAAFQDFSFIHFNTEGYAVPFYAVDAKPWAVIRKFKDKHEFVFYFNDSDPKTPKFPRLKQAIKMKDSDQQQSLMHTLYYDPLYHDPDRYKEQAEKIARDVSYTKWSTKEMYLNKTKDLYKKAIKLQTIMMQGQSTFGCQRRYNLEGENVLKALRRTSIDAEGEYWKSTHSVINYPNEATSDAYKLTKISIPKSFFVPPSKTPSNHEKRDGKKWYHRIPEYSCLEANAIYQLCEMRTDRPSYERTPKKEELDTLFKYVIWGLEIRKCFTTPEESQAFVKLATKNGADVFEIRDHFLEEYTKLFSNSDDPFNDIFSLLTFKTP